MAGGESEDKSIIKLLSLSWYFAWPCAKYTNKQITLDCFGLLHSLCFFKFLSPRNPAMTSFLSGARTSKFRSLRHYALRLCWYVASPRATHTKNKTCCFRCHPRRRIRIFDLNLTLVFIDQQFPRSTNGNIIA